MKRKLEELNDSNQKEQNDEDDEKKINKEDEINTNEINTNEINTNEINTNGINTNGINTNGINTNGINTNEINTNEIIEMKKKKQKIYDTCSICLNDMKDTNVVTTSCNHRFCFQCLMDSCKIKNNCPLCRKEIEQYNQKKLPIFKHINMFNNILDSINNPAYNIFSYIDQIKEIIFDQIIECDYHLTNEEFNIKNNILNKIENSNNLKNNIDTCIYDLMNEFTNKIIVDNTIRMCNWYHNNY